MSSSPRDYEDLLSRCRNNMHVSLFEKGLVDFRDVRERSESSQHHLVARLMGVTEAKQLADAAA